MINTNRLTYCKKVWTFFLILSILVPGISYANFQKKYPIESYTLKNGLKVFIIPDASVPLVHHSLWYGTGSADSPIGKSGLAHFLEHMMFKGTQKFPKNSYDEHIASFGGIQEAYTNWDTTCYKVTMPKDKLSTVMTLEADRMNNLVITQENVELEKKIVLQEVRDRIDGDPLEPLYNAANAAYFWEHPYGKPIIGFEEEIKKYTASDVENFYKNWYAPNNATLIVAGDITAADAKALIDKYYGDLPKKNIPERHHAEPKHLDTNTVIEWHSENMNKIHFQDIFRTPVHTQGDLKLRVALTALEYILKDPLYGRLTPLTEQQKINGTVGASYISYRDAYSFVVSGELEDKTKLPKLKNGISKIIDELVKKGITDKELQLAKESIKDKEQDFSSLETLVNLIGETSSYGHTLDYLDEQYHQVDLLTRDDIHNAAKIVLGNKPELTIYAYPNNS